MSERRTVSGNLPAEVAERMSDRSAFPPTREELDARQDRLDRIERLTRQYLDPQNAAHEGLYDLATELIDRLLALHSARESDARIGREARGWLEETAARFAAREEP